MICHPTTIIVKISINFPNKSTVLEVYLSFCTELNLCHYLNGWGVMAILVDIDDRLHLIGRLMIGFP